jgi:hypothetical protein
MTRSALVSTLFSLCLLAPVGCAPDRDRETSEGAGEDVGETHDALSSVARSIVGKYYDESVPSGGIARLTLASSGKYTAHFEAGGAAFCITAPCLLPESGTWSARSTDTGMRLRLAANGSGSGARSFDVRMTGGQLVVSVIGRDPQKLTTLDANQCLDDADCTAAEECAPRLCLMFCAAGDPFCCGPSTCTSKN